jgi:hypothetical protein
MKMKRTLTGGSYWQDIIRIYEILLIELANLKGERDPQTKPAPPWLHHTPKPGATEIPDPEACARFRKRWEPFLLQVQEDDHKLLQFRSEIRYAIWKGTPRAIQSVAFNWSGDPIYALRKPGLKCFRSTLADGSEFPAPILFDLPRALAVAAIGFLGTTRKLVCCRQCGRCAIGRKNQSFCPGGKCRRAWHFRQPGAKEKRRIYYREKMREYRALEKKRSQINQKLTRGSHAKTA